MAEREQLGSVGAPIKVGVGADSDPTSAHEGDELAAASGILPRGARSNQRGHLEIAGCDVVELVAQQGTPAYIYAEEEMRARARDYCEAFERRGADYEVVFASKSLPCTAAYRLFAEEGLSVDVASGGELHMALRAGYAPARIHMHGNNKTDEEILFAARSGVGHLIVDSFDEIVRCERLLEAPPGRPDSRHSGGKTLHPRFRANRSA